MPHEKTGLCLHVRGCGIHAAATREQLRDINYHDACRDFNVLALGEVALAGRVIPGDMGWRAERARPLRLWIPHFEWELARPLRDAYGVPVMLMNRWKESTWT